MSVAEYSTTKHKIQASTDKLLPPIEEIEQELEKEIKNDN